MSATRTDPHRVGAIVPADYDYLFSYNLATSMDGWPIPSYGINCELDRRVTDKDGRLVRNGEHDADGQCCVVGLRSIANVRFADHGSAGTCTVCGTPYIYGDVWRHKPTGEHIHVGNVCAHKYSMMADRSAHEMALGRLKAAAAVEITKAQNREARDAFLAKHPGLADDLALDHPILRDMKDKLTKWLSLTDKQVAFARRLADEVRNPKPTERLVAAPTGKGIVVRGTVVSTKWHDGFAPGTTVLKWTVKVTTADGRTWLAWGTVPDAMLGGGTLKGADVEFTANLEPGRDKHFVFAKRPRNGRVLAYAPGAAATLDTPTAA